MTLAVNPIKQMLCIVCLPPPRYVPTRQNDQHTCNFIVTSTVALIAQSTKVVAAAHNCFGTISLI